MALKALGNDQGYLKAGMLGYQKSGKSYTSTLLAIGVRKFFGLKGPIAFFDTESGSGYVAEMVMRETGTELLGVRERSFKALMEFTHDCITEKVSVAIVDSITHPWRELCDSYLVQLNQKRRERNFAALQKLEFQHWAAIKGMWEPWSEFFLNSPLHMIVCGRAGAIWEMEKNEETNRRELVQVGTKMKVEGEFGFEPSLLVEMERDQEPDGNGGFRLIHRATVLGDRFSVLDGKMQVNPTFEFFLPHVQRLRPGAHAPVNTANKTDTKADLEGSGDWEREKKARTILCEEIQGIIVEKYPGQSAEEKKTKAALLHTIFNTRSWTAVENMSSEQLREGLYRLKDHFGIVDEPVSKNETDDGDLGPQKPQDASKPAEGVNTPPEPSKPQTGQVPADGTPIQRIRGLLATTKPVLTEVELLNAMIQLGSIDAGIESLEQVALLKPETIGLLEQQFGNLHKAICQTMKK